MSDTDPNHIFTTHHHHYHHAPPKQNTKILSIFLKFIVMYLILSFFLLFIGLAAILLLLAATFLHRRRRHTATTPPPLHHLPVFKYSRTNSNENFHDCSICLEGFKEGDMCRAMQVCDHFFHAECVDTWLVKVPSCPICRRVVRLVDEGLSGDEECRFLWAIGVGRQVDLGW